MPASIEMQPNRRRSFRAGVHGSAVIHAPGGIASRGVIADIGLGGVRVTDLVGDEPAIDPGTAVTVELECVGTGWVAQKGRVIRHHRRELAILFEALAPEVEDLIEDEVLGAVEALREPRVVVVDRCVERRARIAEHLRHCGCQAIEVSTPLEAVEEIERSRNHVAAVALSLDLTQTNPEDMYRYISESHPEVLFTKIEGDGDGACHTLKAALKREH
jgi:CheY-like chemotaxis protein